MTGTAYDDLLSDILAQYFFAILDTSSWMVIGEKEKYGNGARSVSEVPFGMSPDVLSGSNYFKLEM